MEKPVISEFQNLVGRVCITPYDESAGLMLVQEVYWSLAVVGEWMARGIFLGDHPAGYGNGTIAQYAAKDLRPTWLTISTVRAGGLFAGQLIPHN